MATDVDSAAFHLQPLGFAAKTRLMMHDQNTELKSSMASICCLAADVTS